MLAFELKNQSDSNFDPKKQKGVPFQLRLLNYLVPKAEIDR